MNYLHVIYNICSILYRNWIKSIIRVVLIYCIIWLIYLLNARGISMPRAGAKKNHQPSPRAPGCGKKKQNSLIIFIIVIKWIWIFREVIVSLMFIIGVIVINLIILQRQALLDTLESQASAGSKGRFALYNCLMLGHTKYKGVQRVYWNPFPKKPFYGNHRLDPVMIRPPGIEPGGFLVSPDTVWYARVLLLFSASATDTGIRIMNNNEEGKE